MSVTFGLILLGFCLGWVARLWAVRNGWFRP